MPYFYLPSRRIRKESLSLLVCFVIAVGLNVYAIIHYEAPLSELWTSILYVLMATVVLYAVWILLRLLIYGFLCLIGKQPKNKIILFTATSADTVTIPTLPIPLITLINFLHYSLFIIH